MAYNKPNHFNQNKPKPPVIDLSFTKDDNNMIKLKDSELFNETAKAWADAINRTKKTQARNFYEKVLELQAQIKDKGFESVYPFIKMLNSKVAYGVNRRVVSREFQDMMEQCLKQIRQDQNGEQIFQNFKLFFEALLGYFKGSN